MERSQADVAMLELNGVLSLRRSMLAWTMRWCPRGEQDFEAIWRATSDAKALLNVLRAVGAIRSIAVRSGETGSTVRIVAVRGEGGDVDLEVEAGALCDAIRGAFARPALEAVIEAAR